MRQKKNVTPLAKERILNTIRIDRMETRNMALRIPLQPFMEYMMDVTSEALRGNMYENNTINIQNKNAGLKFTITKMEDESGARNHYAVKLYNGNEIRFSGTVMNAGAFDKNQWYFTEKYEDVVSTSDIDQFIEATAILRSKMFTDRASSVTKLLQWVVYCGQPNKKYNFDKDTYVIRNDHDGVIDMTLMMSDIEIAVYTFGIEADGIPQVIHEQNNHEVPPAVTLNLGETIKDATCSKFQSCEVERVKALQDQFNASHAGIHYSERAKLNDLFKNYS